VLRMPHRMLLDIIGPSFSRRSGMMGRARLGASSANPAVY